MPRAASFTFFSIATLLAATLATVSAVQKCGAAQDAIPLAGKVPAVDGRLADGEWADAAVWTRFVGQLDRVVNPRPVTFWMKADATHIYVAQRSTVESREWSPKTPPIWFDKGDSSFVVGLAPGRSNRGDEPNHYLLRVNLHGQTKSHEITWKIKGVRLTFPHPAWVVKPVIAHAFTKNTSEWTSEVAIPLASMKVEAISEGETWGVLLARDYEAADQNANIISSDWKFGDGRRHYGRAFYNHYRLEKQWAQATLGAKPLIAPRSKRSVRGANHDYVSVPDFSLTGYHKGGGLLVPTTVLERYGVYTGVGDKELTATCYDPITSDFYARLNIASLPDLHRAMRGEIVIRRGGQTEPVATHEIADFRADVTLGMHCLHLGTQRGSVLEWVAPADGVADVAYECRQANRHPSDGVGYQLVYFDSTAGKNTVLVPRRQLTHDQGWIPYAAEGLKVSKGDKVHLTYDKWGNEGNDDGRMRGHITLTGSDGGITTYRPAAEFSHMTQGGRTGVWFYRYDEDVSPNADGKYPELRWQGHPWGYSAWLWFEGNEKELEPWKRNQAAGRQWATIRPYRENAERRVRFDLPDLVPGVYQATANIYDNSGTLLGQARQNFIRFNHAKDLPWLGNRIGVTDKVLPPWTPVSGGRRQETGTRRQEAVDRRREAEGGGGKFSCWGREHRVDGSGLFTSIRAASNSGTGAGPREILAGPVRVELAQKGKVVAPSPDPAPNDVQVADHEASWRGTLTGGGWRVETAVTMEYDGYALHRLRICPPTEANAKPELDSLRLVIPLKAEHATHLHAAAGDWFRSAVSSIALRGSGVLWHSGQSHGLGIKPHTEQWGRRMTVGNFKPYVWIGGPHRGLALMADNDQGWVPDDTRKVPAIEVVRDDSQVNLILNLVARPFTFTKSREVVFSLQATPIRPLAPDWRKRIERLHLQTCFPGRDPDGWGWNGCMFWLDGHHLVGGHGSQPYPLNWDRNIKKCKEWENRGHLFTPYQSQLNLMSYAEVDDPRMPPGKQAADVYGYLYPHIAAGCLEHGNLNIARPDLEYRLWCYQAWIKGCGLPGLYFDQTEPILGANPSAGCGYVLDLPDRPELHGRVQPGYLLTNTREFYKRLRAIFVENGVDDPAIWLHTTDANMISAFAFTGAFLEGENGPELTPDHPWFSQKYHPERMQAVTNSGGKWGIGSVWLSMIARSWSWPEARDKQTMTGRSMQGYARLHDYGDQWNYLSWKPFDCAKPMTFYPYWDSAVKAALKTDTPNILAGAYRQENRLQVFVFNRNAETRQGVQVRVDLSALGLQLPTGRTAGATDLKGWNCKADLPLTWQPERTTGTLTLTIPPHDYRIILLAPVDDAK